MKSITIRDLLRKLFRPSPRRKAPLRPRSFRAMLEFLEGRITPAPVVTGISPNNGPQTGGTEVVVTGSGFTGATGAYFGGSYAMYGVVSDGLIDVWSPFHMGGAVDITVTSTGGSSATSAADVFQFNLENTTTSLSSSANPSTYGNSVTLTATVASTVGLMYYPSGTVTFKDNDTVLGTATLSSGMSGMQATLTTSALALGTHPITAVYNGDGNFSGSTSSALTQTVNPPAPAVTAVSPTTGPTTGDTFVIIDGTSFTGATAVNFGGVSAASYEVLSDTNILATSPAASWTGGVDVTVTTPYGASATSSSDQFTYASPTAPAVTSVGPNTGPTTGGKEVVIGGSNFSSATAVDFGGVAAANYCVEADNVILAWSPATATSVVDVTVTTSYGTSATSSADQFTFVVPPVVTAVSPNSGPVSGGTDVEISGSDFTGATSVTFGGVAAEAFGVVSSTEIIAVAPADYAGVVAVVVTTPGGASATTSGDQFTCGTTTTTSLSSSAATSTYGQSVALTATVAGADGGTPTGTVWFDDGGSVIGSAALDGSGTATFTTSDLTVGDHSIQVVYGGDANYVASTSSTMTQTVQTASTTTTLSSSAPTADPGQAVTFTAEVDGVHGGAPTGTVEFYDGTTDLGPGTLSPGGNGSQATLTISTLGAGSHSITAVYAGDANYGDNTSSALTQTVQDNGAYVWTGDVSSDWETAGNWLVNGATATQAPGSSSHVIFDGELGTDNNCATDAGVNVSVNSITIDSNYTGTLTLNSKLTTAGMDMEGGAINQPDGAGVSDITVTAAFNWVAGILNSGTTLGMLFLDSAATLGGTNLTTGDDIEVGKAPLKSTLTLNTTGSVSFDNDAGIRVWEGGTFLWNSTARLYTDPTDPSATGLIENHGTFEKTDAAGMVVTSDLPFLNFGDMKIDQGKLVVDGALPFELGGVSVAQGSGRLTIGHMTTTATLEVDDGLWINGGSLHSASDCICSITGGNVKVTKGFIDIGDDGGPAGIGTLKCSGSVTMSGGICNVNVNLAARAATLWQCGHDFTLTSGNSAKLAVFTIDVTPPAVLPPPLHIIDTRTGPGGGITIDFSARNGLGYAGGGRYAAGLDPQSKGLYLLTP